VCRTSVKLWDLFAKLWDTAAKLRVTVSNFSGDGAQMLDKLAEQVGVEAKLRAV
jgi:hypothetical protein